MEIGVAKPSRAELSSIPHYFINSHSIQEEVNAALFERLALPWTEEIFRERDIAIMVGGTGLYIRAFCEGLDEMPVVDPSLRKEIQSRYEQEGIGWLREEIRIHDPHFYRTGEIQNPQRLMRALEVKLATGKPISSFRSSRKKTRDFQIRKIGLRLDKETLYRRIDRRVEQMIDSGLLPEVRALGPFRRLNALQTVGYTELFSFLDGEISLDQAIDLIKKNTRKYAKRQLTWFARDQEIRWLDPADPKIHEKLTQA